MAKGKVTIKTSLQSIGWKQEYQESLTNLVWTTHFLTKHTCQLAHWILLHKLEKNHDFNPSELFSQAFFDKVFLSLAGKKVMHEKVKPLTKAIRVLIQRHLEGYMKAANNEPRKHSNMTQVAAYVSTNIMTAYKVNVQLWFGEYFQCAVNALLNVCQWKEALHKEMANSNEHEFHHTCEERIWGPACQVC